MPKSNIEDALAHYRLGVAFQKLGKVKEAVTSYIHTLKLKPDFAEAHCNLGTVIKKLGKLREAEASYRLAIKYKPELVEAHLNLGILLDGLGRLKESVASYREVTIYKPDHEQAFYNLGLVLHKIDNLDEAVASYRQAITLKPEYFQAHNNLGVTLHALGRLEEAKASYRKAIKLKPEYFQAHNNLGVTLHALGKLKEAKASYRKAIALKPSYSVAYRFLTQVKTFEKKDEEFSKMEQLYFDKTISDEDRCDINFALAKACEDIGDLAKSFKHYREGNLLRKKLLKYDIRLDIQFFKLLKSSYAKVERNSLKIEKNVNNSIPIFIVGMPRSGTTLVEQIISSHSQVTGAGELPFVARFGHLIATGLHEANTNTLLDFREKYLFQLQKLSNESPFVTDKLPQNFRFLGLLAAAFPEAKIVHVKRDPAALCWANYKQYFTTKSLGYSYSIDDITKYYSLYKNLMKFWQEKLGNKIYHLDYELLTTSQESETQKLIKHLNLKWEKECLSPQENKRAVTTASKSQVRKKVYQGSSEKWKKFKPFLNEAFDFI